MVVASSLPTPLSKMFSYYLGSLALEGAERCALETYPFFFFTILSVAIFHILPFRIRKKHSHDNSHGANNEILGLITLMCDLSSVLRLRLGGLKCFFWFVRWRRKRWHGKLLLFLFFFFFNSPLIISLQTPTVPSLNRSPVFSYNSLWLQSFNYQLLQCWNNRPGCEEFLEGPESNWIIDLCVIFAVIGLGTI